LIDANMTDSVKTCELIVYGRAECHLCQEMIQGLQQRQEQVAFDFEVVDIDADPALVSRYNDKIPVLVSPLDGLEICHHFLDFAALDDYLAKIR